MSITKLLADLGGDANKVAKMKQNPDSVIQEYDLGEDVVVALKESLRTNDPSHLQNALASSGGDDYKDVTVNIIFAGGNG